MKRGRGEKEEGAAPTTLAQLLEQTTVASLKSASNSKPLVTLSASDTVEKALVMLEEHDILSAPVMESLGRWDERSEISALHSSLLTRLTQWRPRARVPGLCGRAGPDGLRAEPF